MAAWNVLVGLMTVIGVLSYTQLGCLDNERSVVINNYFGYDTHQTFNIARLNLNSLRNNILCRTDAVGNHCNADCACDYVKYSPVCGNDRNTYISACHAGCKGQTIENDVTVYTNCSCIAAGPSGTTAVEYSTIFSGQNRTTDVEYSGGSATPGSCPVNCYRQFVIFLAVMCFMKLIGSTGRATNFLVTVR